jgi:hypothetical protein
MMMRASEPPMKWRRSMSLRNTFTFTAICVLHSTAYRPPEAIGIDSLELTIDPKGII